MAHMVLQGKARKTCLKHVLWIWLISYTDRRNIKNPINLMSKYTGEEQGTIEFSFTWAKINFDKHFVMSSEWIVTLIISNMVPTLQM